VPASDRAAASRSTSRRRVGYLPDPNRLRGLSRATNHTIRAAFAGALRREIDGVFTPRSTGSGWAMSGGRGVGTFSHGMPSASAWLRSMKRASVASLDEQNHRARPAFDAGIFEMIPPPQADGNAVGFVHISTRCRGVCDRGSRCSIAAGSYSPVRVTELAAATSGGDTSRCRGARSGFDRGPHRAPMPRASWGAVCSCAGRNRQRYRVSIARAIAPPR